MYDWIPLTRVGKFIFNTVVQKYVDQGLLEKMPDDQDATGWQTYGVPGGSLRVHVEDNRIISIACYDECILNGYNLIGMTFDDAKNVLEIQPSEDVDIIDIGDTRQEVFEFDDLEAQLWVEKGKVVTVFCGPRFEEE